MPVPAGPLSEVGAIVRVSTLRQATESDSPLNQRQTLAGQGATRFYEYVGSGFSAAKRRASPAWQELLTDIRSGKLHRLLTTDISRAARRDELITELIELCDECGVEFLASGLRVSHGNAMQWYSARQMALMAELYSRDLSDRVKRGQAAAIARGVPAFTSKHLPWHLMREPGTRHGVIPNPDRWDDARQVVLDYIEGRDGLDRLSDRIHAKHGVMGNASGLHKWLRSHALEGHYGKRDGPVLIASCFPALITAAEAELLRRRLAMNRKFKGSRSSHGTHALSGLCKCLHCGHPLTYSTVRRRDGQGKYKYLRCGSQRECPGFRKYINADTLEWALIERLGVAWERVAEKAAQSQSDTRVPVEVVQLRQRVRKLEALLNELDSPGVRADLQEAQARLERLEQAHAQGGGQEVDEVMQMLMRADNRFKERPEGERNALLLSVVDHAVVDTTFKPVGALGGRLVPKVVLRYG
jgi:DNA invertase Pin-like site-specific DNA recombinase